MVINNILHWNICEDVLPIDGLHVLVTVPETKDKPRHVVGAYRNGDQWMYTDNQTEGYAGCLEIEPEAWIPFPDPLRVDWRNNE